MDDYKIEIDETTFQILTAITKADNDPERLADLVGINPHEFREFLNACGENENKDGLELLSAAEHLYALNFGAFEDFRVNQLLLRAVDRTKTTFEVGDRVEQMCIKCGEERGQIVASVTKKGRITRVSCPVCGSRVPYSRVPYKRGAPGTRTPKTGAPYDRARTYRRGQTVMHPTFGEGEVTAVGPQKISVLFADRVRRLIHSKPRATYKSD